MTQFKIHVSEKTRRVAPVLEQLQRVVYGGINSPSSLLVFLGGGDGRDIDPDFYPDPEVYPCLSKEEIRQLDMRLYGQVDAIVTSRNPNLSIYENENDRKRYPNNSPESQLRRLIPSYIQTVHAPYTLLTTQRGVEPARRVLTELGFLVNEVVEIH